MAMSRGRRLSKRQKRRSLKRKNVKSRKVMRGGGKNKGACTAYMTGADYSQITAAQKFSYNPKNNMTDKEKGTPCLAQVFLDKFEFPPPSTE